MRSPVINFSSRSLELQVEVREVGKNGVFEREHDLLTKRQKRRVFLPIVTLMFCNDHC